jgi:hypothetical protein
VTERQLVLTAADADLEVVNAELVATPPDVASHSALSPPPPPVPSALAECNLFGEAERIAARAATASTRRQYEAIFPAFGDWRARKFGRPPVVGDRRLLGHEAAIDGHGYSSDERGGVGAEPDHYLGDLRG